MRGRIGKIGIGHRPRGSWAAGGLVASSILVVMFVVAAPVHWGSRCLSALSGRGMELWLSVGLVDGPPGSVPHFR
jgi:hypothetical protein